MVEGLFQVIRSKLVAGLAGLVLVGAGTFLWLRSRDRAGQIEALRGAQTAVSPQQSSNANNSSLSVPERGVDGELLPDPLKLLQAVAEARQRIESGSMELQLASAFFGRQPSETNQYKLAILFDGRKRHFDQVVREYAYTLPGDGPSAAQEAQMREQRMIGNRRSAPDCSKDLPPIIPPFMTIAPI